MTENHQHHLYSRLHCLRCEAGSMAGVKRITETLEMILL